MLTPSQYDRLCDQLTALYADLDESIIEDITRRMLKTGRVTDTARWQAEQLQQAGMLYEDVLAEIAKRTDATQAHVRVLFEDAGVQSIRNDNRFYKAAGLEGIVKTSDSALQTLNAGFVKCAGDLQNLTLTTANAAQEAYLNASNLAYMQVTTGTMDYNTAIRHAVQTAAAEGSFVLYPSGHRDRLDVAIRRAVLTGVGQTVRQLSLINAEGMGCDLMEITAHGGARPSHAAWQGKIVSLSGRKGYLSLKAIGYGTGDGFGGWNCRHDWFPFFEGISQRAYTEERLKELNEPHTVIGGKRYTDYEVTQMQRALERNIRKQKRQVAAANVLVVSAPDEAMRKAAQADFTAQSVKLKAAEQELKDFCKQTGFLPDTSRVWVNGFGRSVSQKAVHANKKALTSGAKSGIIKTGRYHAGIKDLFSKIKGLQSRSVATVSSEYLASLPLLSSPETLTQALRNTNPTRNGENCQRCVPAYEMRRRGYNVTAALPPADWRRDTLGFTGFRDVFVGAEWIKCSGSGLEEITRFLESAGHGSRVEISLHTNTFSHLFVAENDHGRIRFIDPQSGLGDAAYYFSKAISGTTEFARIDGLPVSDWITSCLEVSV